MRMADKSTPARFSLRHLLALVAAVAIALASLKFAGDVWWIVLSTVAAIAFLVALVGAFIERGGRQAFAIGFLLWSLSYGGFLFVGQTFRVASGPTGSDPFAFEPSLPTTRVMRPLYVAVSETKWIEISTGKEVADFDPDNPGNYDIVVGWGGLGGGTGFGAGGTGSFAGFGQLSNAVHQREVPNWHDFVNVAHLLWALLFGFGGGCFAGFVYRRRVAREGAAAKPG